MEEGGDGAEAGELKEEGELPDAPAPNREHVCAPSETLVGFQIQPVSVIYVFALHCSPQDQESGEASGYDDGEIPPEHPPQTRPSFGAPMAGVDPPVPSREGMGFPGGPRIIISPRGAPPPGGHKPVRLDPAQEKEARAAAERYKEEREKEELHSLLRELTNYITVSDVLRSCDTVCQDLKKAIKKLDKLFRKVKVRHLPLWFSCMHASLTTHGLRVDAWDT